jgi:hypothetical protein
MIKKFVILGLTLLLNWTSFSQTDTNKLFISYKVAHLIAIDLVQGDSAIAELEQTQILLEQISTQSSEKDTIIGFYVKKEKNYLTQIQNYNKKEEKYKSIVGGLESDNAILVRKNKFLKDTLKFFGGGIAILAALLIIPTLN